MPISPLALRGLFVAVVTTLFFLSSYSLEGVGSGLMFALALTSLEPLLKKWHPRHFFLTVVGLFFGVLLGEGLYNLLVEILPFRELHLGLVLGSIYVSMIVVSYAADEVAVSIPFVRFKATGAKKRDLVLDLSALSDPRIIDLALSGIVDGHLLIPRFLLKELQTMGDDPKAKRSLETIKRLESTPTLEMKWVDKDFEEIKDVSGKLIKLARSLDANLLTADISRVQQAEIQGVKIINLHLLANALKPLNQSGEWLDIKIQRFGKEPTQGVGYLEDGTMVVVNGGADFIGHTIRAQVLSVKHSGTGRLIFCNAPDEINSDHEMIENSPSQYFVSDYERHRV